MRNSQKQGRLRLRQLMERTEAKAEEMAADRPRFQALAREDAAPRAVSSHNLFQSPPALASQVARMARLSLGRLLEPSAGLGRLYEAARAISACNVTMVEQSADLCGELYRMTEADPDATLIQADFLSCDAQRLGGLFDRVIMNPPFQRGTDIKHIRHAITLLNEGGRLVAICANGPKQRKHLQPIATEWHDLPSGSFKSEGTNVETAIFVYQK